MEIKHLTKNKIYLCGFSFDFTGIILPETNRDGSLKEYQPQANYINPHGKDLHQHGDGTFCKFKIKFAESSGVYLWVVNDAIIYIGECINLQKRFYDYGTISPRNCFKGGQSTNCKMNKVVVECFYKKEVINIYFLETENRKQIEAELLIKVETVYNKKR